jgi:hypothetical protein
VNVGIVVHRYDAIEGTGGYVVELLPRIAEVHDVTLYAARIAAPVPQNVRVIEVPAWMRKAYTAILTFPTAFRAVRKPPRRFAPCASRTTCSTCRAGLPPRPTSSPPTS